MTVLVLTRDPALNAALDRLLAAAGTEVARAADVGSALRVWSSAALVLVGADQAGPLGKVAPPRRPGVHVVAVEEVPDRLFRTAVELGAESVVALPASTQWLAELLTDAGDVGVQRGVITAVVGGSGGVGASVFAAALASVGAGPAVLVDADPLGPGLDRVMGMERVRGVRWEDLYVSTGRLSARALRTSLPTRDGVAVLTWSAGEPTPPPAFAAREVLSAAARGFANVVIDLPRHRDPVAEEMLSRCHRVVLVAGTSVAAATSARRTAAALRAPAVPVLVVARGSGGVAPTRLAAMLGLPLAAALPDQRGLDEALDLGAGPCVSRRGPLVRAARELVGYQTSDAA